MNVMKKFALVTLVCCTLSGPLQAWYQERPPGIYLEHHSDKLFSIDNAEFFLTTAAFLFLFKFVVDSQKAWDRKQYEKKYKTSPVWRRGDPIEKKKPSEN